MAAVEEVHPGLQVHGLLPSTGQPGPGLQLKSLQQTEDKIEKR